jgi:hypothetical protein
VTPQSHLIPNKQQKGPHTPRPGSNLSISGKCARSRALGRRSKTSRPVLHSSRELPSQAAIAEKLDVSMSSIKRARTIKATGATAVLEAAFLPEGSHALSHPRRIQDRSNDARLQAGDAAPMAASPLTPISMPKIRRPAAPGFRVFMMSVFFSRRPKSSQVVPRNLGWPDHFRDQKVAKNLPDLGLWHKCGGASRTLPRVR